MRKLSNFKKLSKYKTQESKSDTLKIFVVSLFVVLMWQSLFTIFEYYIGPQLPINIIILIISSIVIYYLTGTIELF